MGDGHLLGTWLEAWGGWVLVLFGVVLVLHGLKLRGCLRVVVWVGLGAMLAWWLLAHGMLQH